MFHTNDQPVFAKDKSATDEFAGLSLQQLFEAQVVRAPQHSAVQWGSERLTYAALNERANQLAHYLQKLGVGPDVPVGLCLERSFDMVIALLAIVKAGGCYVPLDPAYPPDRLALMMQTAALPCLLTSHALQDRLPAAAQTAADCTLIWLDESRPIIAQEATTNLCASAQPDHLLYLLFTSGSTGAPKGVAMPQRALVNLLQWQQTILPTTPGQRTLQFTPLSFDVATQEVFATLCYGGTLVLVADDVRRHPQALVQLLATEQIERLFLPFVALQQLAEAAQGQRPAALREVITAGEQLQTTPALTQFFRQPGCRLHNHYGPTESHVVTAYTLPADVDTWGPLPPIGSPLPNVQIYILDEQMQTVPAGETGELYIGGVCLAHGYYQRPDLTQARFLPNPFGPGKLYKTGDLARYLADGQLEYSGRSDQQVKLRGFRVELGEIEVVLARHPQVSAAVVTLREDTPGLKRLVAYVVLADKLPKSVVATRAELRAYVSEKLPEYMVPALFVPLKTLPLTPSGKVDRQQLPHPGQFALASPRYVAPTTPFEQQLAKIWAYVLGRQPIGLHDNFFDLGGHSLAAARLFIEMETLIGRRLPLATLLQAPTIAQLATVLQQEGWTPPWSSLVPIQPEGTKPPFFCVHGFGGDVVGYFDLAQLLGPDQPFYGLQAQGLDGTDTYHTDIEAAATYYIEAMRSLQPNGPYFLGGYCYGGVVAFEMARQLQQQGQKIGLLAIFEAYALARTEAQKQLWRPDVFMSFLSNLPYWLKDNFQPGGPYHRLLQSLNFFNSPSHLLRWGQQRGLAQLKTTVTDVLQNTADVSAHRRKLFEAHERATELYQPQPYAGCVTLFRVQAMSLFRAYDPEMGWGKVAQQGVELRLLEGAHYNILEKPYVASLAAHLKASLEQAHQAWPSTQI